MAAVSIPQHRHWKHEDHGERADTAEHCARAWEIVCAWDFDDDECLLAVAAVRQPAVAVAEYGGSSPVLGAVDGRFPVLPRRGEAGGECARRPR
jgi:hypothetical protein